MEEKAMGNSDLSFCLKASHLGEVPSVRTGRRGDGGRSTATFPECPAHPSVTYGDSSPMRGAKAVNLNLKG